MKKHEEDDGSGAGSFNGTLVPITVTPLFQKGHVVACDINPPQNLHAGGHVKLGKNIDYTLQFTLVTGNPDPLAFKPNKPDGSCDAFWSDPDDCPHNQGNAAGYRPTRTSPTVLTVDVTAPGQDSCVYYRLNFDNGYFDPVIIHQ